MAASVEASLKGGEREEKKREETLTRPRRDPLLRPSVEGKEKESFSSLSSLLLICIPSFRMKRRKKREGEIFFSLPPPGFSLFFFSSISVPVYEEKGRGKKGKGS